MTHPLYKVLLHHGIHEEKAKEIIMDYSYTLMCSIGPAVPEASAMEIDLPPKPSKKEYSRQYEVTTFASSDILKEAPDIKRGDVIYLKQESNRRRIWDGKDAIDFVVLYPYYTCVPSEFTLNEFPNLDFFDDTIRKNTVRWIKFGIGDIKELKEDTFSVEVIGMDKNIYRYEIKNPHGLKKLSKRELYAYLLFQKGTLPVETAEYSPDGMDILKVFHCNLDTLKHQFGDSRSHPIFMDMNIKMVINFFLYLWTKIWDITTSELVL